MRYMLAVVAVMGFVLSGCEAQPVPAPMAPANPALPGPTGGDGDAAEPVGGPAIGDPATGAGAVPEGSDTETPADSGAAAAPAPGGEAATPTASIPTNATPVALSGDTATLSPDNTKIQFVGLHLPPKEPDPRTGGFAKFSGQAKIDPAAKTLQSVAVDIDTTSLFTAFDKLTTHLKSGDFFEVNEYPTAKFESTKITAGDAGQATITGNLTLHGVTKEISFPATVAVTDEGLTLASEFNIDRTQFGITFGEDSVAKDVAMTVVIGEKTVPQ
jgi:polyisoprenoid-binding protein YceI